MRSVKAELREVIANLPGITLPDIRELMPHVNTSTLTARLQALYLEGEVLRQKVPPTEAIRGRKYMYAYSINPDPKPVAHTTRNNTPSAAAYEDRIAKLKERIAELEAWRAGAIQRYPDLDVDPVILEARKIVAEELQATDSVMAKSVLAGQKDNILPMRVTIAALNRAA